MDVVSDERRLLQEQLADSGKQARLLRKQLADELDKLHPLRAQLARNVIRLRKARGWTQETLAHETKLHRNQIGAIEQRRQSTGVDIIEILVNTLGVRPGELLDIHPDTPAATSEE